MEARSPVPEKNLGEVMGNTTVQCEFKGYQETLQSDVEPQDRVFVHKLRVCEAKISDAGRNIVRIDGSSLILLDLQVHDIVLVVGENGFKAAAECLDSELLEIEPVIRMDKVMRTNLGLKLGDLLLCSSLSKVDHNSIRNDVEITLDPLLARIPSSVDERYVATALSGMSVTAGQAVVVPYYGGNWLPFIVIGVRSKNSASSNGEVAIIGSSTRIVFGSLGLAGS